MVGSYVKFQTPHMFSSVAGRPFPLQNCTSNHTASSLQVSCIESFDGGLPQIFLMELLELPSYATKFNVSVNQTPPEFRLFGIETGTTYEIRLYAVNAKGRSDPVILETVTFKGVAKYSSKNQYRFLFYYYLFFI